jgi:hypothetical protein
MLFYARSRRDTGRSNGQASNYRLARPRDLKPGGALVVGAISLVAVQIEPGNGRAAVTLRRGVQDFGRIG